MQQNTNTSFSFTVDFSDVTVYTPKKKLELVEGYYKVLIAEAYINPERNANRAIFKLEFQDDYAGNSKLTGLNLPGTTQNDVRSLWMNLMLSAGFTEAQIKTGAVKISTDILSGKTVHLYFKPKSEDATDGSDSAYDKFTFLSVEAWTNSKANFESKQAAQVNKASAPSKPVVAQDVPKQTAGFAAPNVSSADLLNMIKG